MEDRVIRMAPVTKVLSVSIMSARTIDEMKRVLRPESYRHSLLFGDVTGLARRVPGG